MKNALKALESIKELIPSNTQEANKALQKFTAGIKNTGGGLLKAKAELLGEMIALDIAPYDKRKFDGKKLLTCFSRVKKYDDAAWALLASADNFFYRGNLQQGENCLQQIREKLADKISLETESTYLLRMAHVSNVKREYAQRMYIGMQGLEKMKAADHRNTWWYANYTAFCIVIADSYFRNDQFEEAWPYLQDALEIDKTKTISTRFRQDIYHHIATYYSIKDDNKTSIEWYEKAIDLLKNEHPNHTNLVGLYYLISYGCFLAFNQTPSAQKTTRSKLLLKMEHCLDHCEKIVLKLDSPLHMAHLQSSRSRLELLKKNYGQAIRLLNISLPVHQKFNHLNGITEYYHIGNRIYYEWARQKNDPPKLWKAYKYLETFNRIVRDNAKKITQRKLDAVRDTYELKQKKLNEQLMQQQIEALNKEIHLATLNLHDKIIVLDELKTFVQSLRKKDLEMRQLTKSIVQKIESVKITEHDKNRLQQKLTESNRDYDKLLIEKHPALTKLEVNMCSLFRTGITDKELAKLYGQGYKSYEQHRWRIKKKMGLGRDVNLVKYLVGLGRSL
ncbi:MAG TPA: hypothetical protein VK154_20675 [Chitinophagales bacterium]|nr:hypothetical protein [Chitinophagales bacterium]